MSLIQQIINSAAYETSTNPEDWSGNDLSNDQLDHVLLNNQNATLLYRYTRNKLSQEVEINSFSYHGLEKLFC